MQLKLISYNILQGQYLDKLGEFLSQQSADIVCLQEVCTEGSLFKVDASLHVFQELEKMLQMPGDYERMFWGNEGAGKYDLGVAIISRFPVLERVHFSYERNEVPGNFVAIGNDRYNLPRKLLGNRLDLGGGRSLWVMTTHFTITPEASVTDWQLKSVSQLQGFLRDYPEFILTGDMNTPYGNETYRRLTSQMTDITPHTVPTLHPTIHPVGKMNYHVDYVFTRGTAIKPVSCEIPVVDASDHLPVVATLNVE